MKKTLLLSVVASTMIMAGGDIAPVVEAPAVVSGWDFSGQAVAYYQTKDAAGDLFAEEASIGNLGLQLRAVNADVAYGIGAGFELSGLGEFPFGTDGYAQEANGEKSSGWISQAYLTYGFANTSIKVGRQELPKALSPFAFSEGWNVFKNTFDAALVVNTDLTDTTLVGAYVRGANSASTNTRKFRDIHSAQQHAQDGAWMLTAQNKSVENLTLTGTWYYADMSSKHGGADIGNLNILWADAKYAGSNFTIAGQGGAIMNDVLAGANAETSAFGVKLGTNLGIFDASLAYSSVNDGAVPIHNLGTVTKTPLYTQMVGNQDYIKSDSNTFVLRAGAKVLGGKLGVAYNTSDIGDNSGPTNATEYSELDVTYKMKVFNDTTTLFAAYVYQDDDSKADTSNLVRLWARYNF